MSELVRVSQHGEIAVITIDNPPVNALSPGVPEGIAEAIAALQADGAVRAAVLIGAGRMFIAGADIREFGKMVSGETRGPGLNPVCQAIEDARKPVIMAIHGTALGGGLEIAMAGHYRVALATAKVGQPEVKLGLIPGAGGTQRLPRLAGVPKAIEMCAFGEPVGAGEALAAGILDRLIQGDLLEGALAFARAVVEAGSFAPRTRDRSAKLATGEQNAAVVAEARARAAKKLRGQRAPQAAIEAVEAAARLPFEEGLALEAELFRECLFSEQSRAMIHLFFGEREVTKVPGIGKEVKRLPVASAAVVGAGTMGTGIAMAYANAGVPVQLKEKDPERLARGLEAIRRNYERSIASGRFTGDQAAERAGRIRPAETYEELSGADIVVEAVFEDLALKKEVFGELDRVMKPDAILATNTSSLDIDAIAGATARPGRVVGHHFFSPANVMRLLEIVRGKATEADVLATSLELAKRLGKIGVVVGNCPGFVGNRMFGPYRREAQFLVEEGMSPAEVDQALYDWGMAMGPLAVGDLAGLDVGWRIRREFRHLEAPGVRYPNAEDLLCEAGRLGQKTGAGWYRYGSDRRPEPDREAERLVREWALEAGIPQARVYAEECIERTIYALVNEGARLLEEGIALRAVDIDIVYAHGYGFPVWRGGPMWHADRVGLDKVYRRVAEFHERFGYHWRPAPLLERLAREGGTFAGFRASQSAAM